MKYERRYFCYYRKSAKERNKNNLKPFHTDQWHVFILLLLLSQCSSVFNVQPWNYILLIHFTSIFKSHLNRFKLNGIECFMDLFEISGAWTDHSNGKFVISVCEQKRSYSIWIQRINWNAHLLRRMNDDERIVNNNN